MKKFRKSFLVFFLAVLCTLCLAFGLTACDKGDDETTDKTEGGGTTPSTMTSDSALDLLADNLGTEYTITVKNFSIAIPDSDSIYLAPEDNDDVEAMFTYDRTYIRFEYNEKVTFEADEMYISFSELNDEVVFKVYAEGTLSYYPVEGTTLHETASATLYGDGENFNIVYSYPNFDGVISVSYDFVSEFLSEIGEYEDDETAALISNIYNNIISYVNGEDGDFITTLTEILNDSLSAFGQNVDGIIDEFFTTTESNGGYTITLDCSVLSSHLDDLYTLTYSELIDKTYGEGMYESIKSYISGISGKTMGDVLTDLFAATAEYGLDKQTTFELVETIVEEIFGVSVNLSDILYGDGTIESQYEIMREISEMNAVDFLEEYLYTTVDELMEGFEEMELYTYFQLTFGSYADEFYAEAKDMISQISDAYSIVIDVSSNGAIEASIDLTGAPVYIDGDTYTVNCDITISNGANIPANAASTVSGSDIYTGFASTLYGATTSGKCTLTNGGYITSDGSSATYTFNSNTYNISASSSLSVLMLRRYDDDEYLLDIINLSGIYIYEIDLDVYIYEYEDDNSSYSYLTYDVEKYDKSGNILLDVSYDPSGTTSTYTYRYDSYGNRTYYEYTEKDSEGNVTGSSKKSYTYTYNKNGNILTEKCKDDNGTVYTKTNDYDSNGNPIKNVYVYYHYTSTSTYSYTSTYTYEYDGENNLIYKTYERKYNTTVEYSSSTAYDSNGLVIESIYSQDGYTKTHTYTYNEFGDTTYSGYVKTYNGEVVESWSYTYTYDSNNKCTKEYYTETNSYGYTTSSTTTYTYTYNSDGRLTEKTEDNGSTKYTYTYTYDSNGYWSYYKKTTTNANGTSYWESTTYTRNSNGRTIKTVYETSDGTTETVTYDDDYNKLSETHSESSGYKYSYTYSYNDDDKMTSKIYSETTDGVTYTMTYTYTYSGTMLTKFSVEYVCGSDSAMYTITYNNYHQKTSEVYTDSNNQSYSYTWTYDENSNLTAEKYTSSAGNSYSYTYTFDTIYKEDTYTFWAEVTITDASGNIVRTYYDIVYVID